MTILPMGTGTRGYRTRMGRVWAYFYTHGYYPYPTHLVMVGHGLFTRGYTHNLPIYTNLGI
jgi:hypothetical protein